MKAEERMGEFKQVAYKEVNQIQVENVNERMNEFEAVPKKDYHQKSGQLPYGAKTHMPCETCNEMMEIEELKQGGAIYYCSNCESRKQIRLEG